MALHFPVTMPYSQQELQQKFGVVDDIAWPEKATHFKLIIPLNWKRLPIAPVAITEAEPLVQRAIYRSAAESTVQVTVSIMYIRHEINPSDWLAIYLDLTGERVEQQRYTRTEGGKIPDVLTINDAQPEALVSRWMVIKDWVDKDGLGGAYLYILRTTAPLSQYDREVANTMFLNVANFDLLNPSSWTYAERLRTLTRKEPISFSIAYPESWRQIENPGGNQAFYQVQLVKQINRQEVSRITLATISKDIEPDMKRIPELFRTGYKEQGITFNPLQFKIYQSSSFDKAWLAQANQTIIPTEDAPRNTLTALVGGKGNTWLYIEQFTHSRAVSPEAWSVGKRAFEIVLNYLKTV